MKACRNQRLLKLCDIHGEVLEGHIDLSNMKSIPEGHPVDVFKKENEEYSMKDCSEQDL
ncbi:MAG: hypothetical protein U5K32_05235 [Bacteroidales bacterium]|nr:hypothetical protein [Bacteroidales bacterium]